MELSEVNKTWFKAREYCLNQSGDLIYLKPGESFLQLLKENHLRNNITELLKQQQRDYFFIGARHRIWQWNGWYTMLFDVD